MGTLQARPCCETLLNTLHMFAENRKITSEWNQNHQLACHLNYFKLIESILMQLNLAVILRLQFTFTLHCNNILFIILHSTTTFYTRNIHTLYFHIQKKIKKKKIHGHVKPNSNLVIYQREIRMKLTPRRLSFFPAPFKTTCWQEQTLDK